MPILIQIYTLVILSLVVASTAWTVTQEKIFEEWREAALKRARTPKIFSLGNSSIC